MIEVLLKKFAYVRALSASAAALEKENGELKAEVARLRAITERPEGALPELVNKAKAVALDSLMQMAQASPDADPELAAKILTALEFYGGRMLADRAYPKKAVKAAVKGRAA